MKGGGREGEGENQLDRQPYKDARQRKRAIGEGAAKRIKVAKEISLKSRRFTPHFRFLPLAEEEAPSGFRGLHETIATARRAARHIALNHCKNAST